MNRKLSIATAAFYAACAIAPAVVLSTCLALVGEYPFGDIHMLAGDYDLAYQYANLLTWFQNVLLGDANLMYSQGKSLGGNMFVTYSYYVASPLNLLLGLFPRGDIEDFYFFVRLLRTALCGLTMALFLSKRFGSLARPTAFALALSYALCQYNLIQAANIMWLDAPILIPLVALGVWHFVKKGRLWLCVLTLAFSIVSCWYTGYMMVLASLAIFCMEYCLWAQEHGGFRLATFIKKLFKFCLVLLLVAAAVAVILLPSAYGLFSGKGSNLETASKITRCHPWDFITAVLPMSFKYNWTGPQLFCGTLTLVGMALLLFTRKVKHQQKAVIFGALFVLLICMIASPLDRVWTGFTEANNYYCRWAFVVEFFFLFAAAFAFSKGIPEKHDIARALVLVLAVGVLGLILGGFSAFNSSFANALIETDQFQNTQNGFVKDAFNVLNPFVCFTVFIVVCVLLVLSWAISRHRRSMGNIAVAVLVIAVSIDTSFNAFSSIAVDEGVSRNVYSGDYNSYLSDSSGALGELKASDPGLFRTEKTYSHVQDHTRCRVPTSEGLALGYMPLSSYLSTNDTSVSRFMGNMGYMARQSDADSVFQGTYPTAILPSDSLLGLRYVGSGEPVQGYEPTDMPSGGAGHFWFKNSEAFPLAFGVGDSATQPIDVQPDAFSYQNKLFQTLFNTEAQMYIPLKAEKTTSDNQGVCWTVNEDSSSDLCFAEIRSIKSYKEHYWDVFSLRIGDTVVPGGYYWAFTYGIVGVNRVSAGEQIALTGSPEIGNDEHMTLYLVETNKELLDELNEKAQAKKAIFSEFRDGYLTASYTASTEDKYLFMSIPYDNGWTVKVNGEVVKPDTVADCLMAIPVHPGENNIELSYCSPLLKEGAAISALTWLGILVFIIMRARASTWRKINCGNH